MVSRIERVICFVVVVIYVGAIYGFVICRWLEGS
jgi:hypothetical protein